MLCINIARLERANFSNAKWCFSADIIQLNNPIYKITYFCTTCVKYLGISFIIQSKTLRTNIIVKMVHWNFESYKLHWDFEFWNFIRIFSHNELSNYCILTFFKLLQSRLSSADRFKIIGIVIGKTKFLLLKNSIENLQNNNFKIVTDKNKKRFKNKYCFCQKDVAVKEVA